MRNAAFSEVVDSALSDPRIIFVASDISEESVARFRKEVPQQILMEGIAEAHLIGMSSGLAKEGNIVFVNTISAFLTKRCFEQIEINVCLENANVKMLSQGGGIIYSGQGPSHHALNDLALMRSLPNMTVLTPCDVAQVRECVQFAVKHQGPVYIRLGKGSEKVVSTKFPFDFGKPIVFKQPGDTVFISFGTMVTTALEVSERILGSGVVGIHTIKPFCHFELAKIIDEVSRVIIIEEHFETGGLSSCVAETIAKYCRKKPKFMNFSLNDSFVRQYGTHDELLKLHGLDSESIYQQVLSEGHFS